MVGSGCQTQSCSCDIFTLADSSTVGQHILVLLQLHLCLFIVATISLLLWLFKFHLCTYIAKIVLEIYLDLRKCSNLISIDKLELLTIPRSPVMHNTEIVNNITRFFIYLTECYVMLHNWTHVIQCLRLQRIYIINW